MSGTGASPRPSVPPPTTLRLVENEVCARARKLTPEAGVLPSPNSASSNPPVVPAPSSLRLCDAAEIAIVAVRNQSILKPAPNQTGGRLAVRANYLRVCPMCQIK
ncbi:MAG: hypothetical protein DME22_05770 [Verrucomicrobia bacterium]|nr:MAG: hypothetical protein DME22_05770 [Verrucomicrobiota bacterium]PYJ95571.1 MAG: hypothetical protein DME23_23735 [Verrucomicrobiota bacterium]